MAPPVAVNKPTVPAKSTPVPPPATPDQELGRAALAIKEAQAERAQTTDPKKLAAADAKLETAKKAFAKALGTSDMSSRKAATALYERREKLLPALEKARATSPGSKNVKELEAALGTIEKELRSNQESARRSARGDKDGFESPVDGASKNIDAQKRVYGAPIVGVSADEALKHDVDKVKRAFEYGAGHGFVILKEQLKDSPIAYQKKLLAALKPEIENNAGRMGLGIIELAPQPEKQQLADLLVKRHGDPTKLAVEAVSTFTSGDGIEAAGALLKSMPAGPAREILIDGMTLAVRRAQDEYASTKQAAEKLQTEYGRTTFGFAGAVPQDKLKAYRDSFMEKNAATFAKADDAAAKYLKIAKAATGGTFDGANKTAYDSGLRLALKPVADDLPGLLETKPGKELLEQSLQAQAAGQPSFLDQLSTIAGTSKAVTDTVANAMVKYWVLSGHPKGDPATLGKMIERNKAVFGISDRHIETYKQLIVEANNPKLSSAERIALQTKAAKTIQAGNNHGRLGSWATILLTGPSLINGWYNFKDASELQKVQTVLGTAVTAKEIVSLVNDAKVLEHIGNVGNGIGAVLSFVQGGMEIADGKYVDGGTSIAAGVGGVAMLIPGGQLAGAIIIAGATLARLAWGSDPGAEAETKAEKATMEFLMRMGVKMPQADVLSDVLQKDLRSVGAALPALARELQMRPEDLFKHLAEMDPVQLRQFVDMVKELPSNEKWEFPRNSGNDAGRDLDRSEISSRQAFRDGHYEGPRSLENATKWMRKHGFVPAKGKYEVWHGEENERTGPKAGFGNSPRRLD